VQRDAVGDVGHGMKSKSPPAIMNRHAESVDADRAAPFDDLLLLGA
jgi:hypothetical protein